MFEAALALWLLTGVAMDAAPVTAPADVAAPPPDATTTPSGVAMKVIKPGKGSDHPKSNDCVKLHFTVWKRDGSWLSTTRQSAEPKNQCLAAIFPGVAEALSTMVVGEQRRVWVPASLTFTGDDDDRPPLVDATFD